MTVQENLNHFTGQLPAHCRLIAVSKTHPAEAVLEAYQAGHKIFGENKVQELVPKYEALPKDIEWHLIGHLQTNKVKYIASFASMIHSVDSFKLLQEIDKQAKKSDRIVSCLLQVHIAEEETKFGFSEDEITTMINSSSFNQLMNIKVEGLMGMATFTDDKEQVRKEFRSLKNLFDKLKSSVLPKQVMMKELSMGMSGDYQIAIEEGSTMVRIGTAIFGVRNYTS